MNIAEKQVTEESDPELEWEEYFGIYNDREDHW